MGFPALAGGALALALTLPNQHLAAHETLGRVFGDGKSPCGNGDTHSLVFPHQIGVFGYGKTLGRVFGGGKSPCGNGDTHSLGFPHQIGVFGYGKTLGCVFGGTKSPCGKHADSHPGFGEARSRTRCLQDASSVCQPTGQFVHHSDGGSLVRARLFPLLSQ